MGSRVIFLGTGGGRYTTASQVRATGGIIIQTDDTQLHLDPGPGSVIRAKQYGVDLKKNDVVLVSHEHIDNCNDANLVVDAMTVGGKEKRGVLISNQGFSDHILTDFHKSCLDAAIVLSPGKDTKIGNIIVRATPTKSHAEGIGFKIITAGFVLGYTSDTTYSKDMAESLSGCDIIIVNNMLPFMKISKKHMSSDATVKLLTKTTPKLAIIQHFGKFILEKNPLYEAREIQKQSGVQVVAATDGLVINPSEYAAKGDQKRLLQY